MKAATSMTRNMAMECFTGMKTRNMEDGGLMANRMGMGF